MNETKEYHLKVKDLKSNQVHDVKLRAASIKAVMNLYGHRVISIAGDHQLTLSSTCIGCGKSFHDHPGVRCKGL